MCCPGERWPPADYICPTLSLLKTPNRSSLGFKPVCISRPHRQSVGQLDGSPAHVQTKIFPWAQLSTGQTSRSPPRLCLSPQYVKAHPLDLKTPDPLLTPVVTSNIQRLQLPGHETIHIQTHACSHTYRTYVHLHVCTAQRSLTQKHTTDGGRGHMT